MRIVIYYLFLQARTMEEYVSTAQQKLKQIKKQLDEVIRKLLMADQTENLRDRLSDFR